MRFLYSQFFVLFFCLRISEAYRRMFGGRMVEVNTKVGLSTCVTKMQNEIIDQFANRYNIRVGLPVSGRQLFHRKRVRKKQEHVTTTNAAIERKTFRVLYPLYDDWRVNTRYSCSMEKPPKRLFSAFRIPTSLFSLLYQPFI